MGAILRGKVTSEQTGLGIAGVVVTTTGGLHCVPCRDITDADGSYRLTGLTVGTYTVSFDGSGRDANLSENGKHVAPYFNNSFTATVPATTTTAITLNVSLQSALNIIGQVIPESVDFNLFYPLVHVLDSNGNIVGNGIPFRDSQQFYVAGLLPGTYWIRTYETQYTNDLIHYYPEYYDNKHTFEEADPITITAGNVVSNVIVTLRPRSLLDIELTTAATLTDVIVANQYQYDDASFGYSLLRYSLDGGKTWSSLLSEPWITSTTDYDRHFVSTLVPRGDLSFPIRIIRASNGYGYGVTPINGSIYRTGDFGASWATFTPVHPSNCLSNFNQSYSQMVNSPSNPTRLYLKVVCFFAVPDFGLASYARLLTSDNAGIDWQEVSPIEEIKRILISPVLPNRIYDTGEAYPAYSHSTLRQSDDGGKTWTNKEEIPVSYIAFDWIDPQQIYGIEDKDAGSVFGDIYGSNNVYLFIGKRSNDGGKSWVDWQEQPCRTSFLQFMALQQANTLLMQCLQGLYRSTNGGDNWEKLPETVDQLVAVDYAKRNRIFAQRQGKLYASLDQGSTWTELSDWHSSMWLPFVSR